MAADLADAVAPLVVSGWNSLERSAAGKAGAAGEAGAIKDGVRTIPIAAIDRASHFELFACDLVVSETGRVCLMEVGCDRPAPTLAPSVTLA